MIALFSISELEEGDARGLEVNDRYLFAVKKDDQIYLYWNSCPHLGTPLEWEEDKFLDGDGALIQCATHGALFRIEDGHCLAGPCRGKNLRAIPFTVEQDLVMVDEALVQPARPS